MSGKKNIFTKTTTLNREDNFQTLRQAKTQIRYLANHDKNQ